MNKVLPYKSNSTSLRLREREVVAARKLLKGRIAHRLLHVKCSVAQLIIHLFCMSQGSQDLTYLKQLVVIPTYNERANIQELVPRLLELYPALQILIVDDNSPDGTALAARELIPRAPGRVHLLLREAKSGLGKAYLAGFDWALQRGCENVIQMDADFAHRPEDLERILEALKDHDFVVGSRYVAMGSIANWEFWRRLVSRAGSVYARAILGAHLNDWTGGFNGWRRTALQGLRLEEVRSEGYCFLIELKYRAIRYGFKGLEVPIVFDDRRVGQSKMSLRIVLEAIYRVWLLRFLV